MGALPAFVTFTGLDAWTDLDYVEDLSRRYPIEWGILFSPTRRDLEPRYPGRRTVEAAIARPIRLAAHLCGSYARTIVGTGECPEVEHLLEQGFYRFQVNTADETADPLVIRRFAERMRLDGRGILQSRNPMYFPFSPVVDWLFDRSGGRGVLPGRWPLPQIGSRAMVGFAGGLGLDTARMLLDCINDFHPQDVPFWLDMESRIRTDDRLDLDKCEAVCRAVYGGAGAETPSPQTGRR